MSVRNLRILVAGTGLALALLVPFMISSRYQMGVMNTALITGVLVLGLNVAKGYTGLISVGHAGFWGMGAYTAALLAVDLRWPAVLTLPASVVVGALAGAVVGIPALRLRGLFLAMVTIGFGLMVQLTAQEGGEFTRGPDGIHNIPPLSLGPLVASSPRSLYYVLLVFVALSAWLCLRVEATKLGRAMRAINTHEVAAELMGVDTFAEKVRAFSLSAGLAGLAGGLYAHAMGYIAPALFSFDQSVLLMVMLVIGGIGSVGGALSGTVLFTLLPEFMRPLRYWYMAIFGAVVMLIILVAPGGLMGLAHRWLPWLFPSPATPEQDAEGGDAGIHLPQLLALQPPAGEAALCVRGLTVRFGGVEALGQVDLDLAAGEIHALIGPNGAGKTTLVNCITGAYTPVAGTVGLQGSPLNGLRPHQTTRRGVTRTFQNLALWRDLSVLDNLLVARIGWQEAGFWQTVFATPAARAEEADALRRAEALLRAVGLWGMRRLPVGSLPYGHQKMVEMARALMTSPRVLLLDEPAAGLTRPELDRLGALMRAVRAQGVAILLIEHNMDLVMGIADRITVLNFGRRIVSGPPAEVRRNPAVVEAYLGAAELDGPEGVAAHA